MADDGLASSVVTDDFSASYAQMEPLDPLPCPIIMAWLRKTRSFPMASYDNTARPKLLLSPVQHDVTQEAIDHRAGAPLPARFSVVG
jgi:hypothetical protein